MDATTLLLGATLGGLLGNRKLAERWLKEINPLWFPDGPARRLVQHMQAGTPMELTLASLGCNGEATAIDAIIARFIKLHKVEAANDTTRMVMELARVRQPKTDAEWAELIGELVAAKKAEKK